MLFACAKPGKRLESPRLTLVNISVKSVTLFETILTVELRVMNPNDAAIEIRGIDCDLHINGNKIAAGVSNVNTGVPPFGSNVIPVTFYSSLLDAVKWISRSQPSESLRYRLTGRVHIAGGFLLPPTVPFSSEGVLPVPKDNNP